MQSYNYLPFKHRKSEHMTVKLGLKSFSTLIVTSSLMVTTPIFANTDTPKTDSETASSTTQSPAPLQGAQVSSPKEESLSAIIDPKADQAEWFTVELIIFKHIGNGVKESFPDYVEFNVPTPLRTLEALEIPAQTQEYLDQNQIIYSTDIITESSDLQENTAQHPSAVTTNTEDATQAIDERKPFINQPLAELEAAYKQLNRSQNYEIILSAAWQQEMHPKEEAINLHFLAGNWYDLKPEFEGFLKVSKQRYLHAYADFFLRRYSLKSDVNFNTDNTDISWLTYSENKITNASETTDPAPEAQLHTINNQGIQSHHFSFGDPLADLNTQGIIDSGNDQQVATSYITDEVFHISEDRIMKHSKDLYYLDHPKFGALIKLTPINDETEAETNEAQ